MYWELVINRPIKEKIKETYTNERNEKPANHWCCKREREREHNLEKLSFICNAKNKLEIKDEYVSINKTDYFAIFKLTVTKQLILQDSLFYWPLEKNNINFRR